MTRNDLLAMTMAEYNVLVRMDKVEEKTAGGLYLPEKAKADKVLSEDMGTLVNAGEHAFSYASWDGRKPGEGDRVLIARYDGKLYEVEGEQYRIVKDKSVVGFWPAREAMKEAA